MRELVSTRDPSAEARQYTDIIIDAKPHDGGLIIPLGAEYPQARLDDLAALQGCPYEEVANYVKGLLIGDGLDAGVQARLNAAAYSRDNFPNAEKGNVAPLVQLEDKLFMLNLGEGPTFAFKDFGMQSLSREVEYALSLSDRYLKILGATSGDTGPAAERAFKGMRNMEMHTLSPEKGMARLQSAQMGELSGGNIFNYSVEGALFGACQRLVKDPAFREYGAVNSINWGRLVAQVPYYFAAYLQAVDKVGDPVDFVVPTGNFGNMYSGIIARHMGLPIRNLVLATNENSVMHELVQTGVYQRGEEKRTSSPSMDIDAASNYERLVYELFDGDTGRVRSYMDEFETSNNHRVSFADHKLTVDEFKKRGILSGSSNHEDRLRTIRRVFDNIGTVIDPHTADAVKVALDVSDPAENVVQICLGTASPVKFETTIAAAIGADNVPARDPRALGIEKRVKPGAFTIIKPSVEALRAAIAANTLRP